MPTTLEELDSDNELRELHERVARLGQAALSREEEAARRRSLDALGAPPFPQALAAAGCRPLRRDAHVSTLQAGAGGMQHHTCAFAPIAPACRRLHPPNCSRASCPGELAAPGAWHPAPEHSKPRLAPFLAHHCRCS